MSFPSDDHDPVCIQADWKLDPRLAAAIARVIFRGSTAIGRTIRIISGFRSIQEQLELKRQGRPAADPNVSTHTMCPATGVDLSIGFAPTTTQKAILGRIAVEEGLRWGGGSAVDPETGIPSDWNHFDLGPRWSHD